jgi:hypothetical protein
MGAMSQNNPECQEEAEFWAREGDEAVRGLDAEMQALGDDAAREMGLDPNIEDCGCKD